MALKDWRKRVEDNDFIEWENKKNEGLINIFKEGNRWGFERTPIGLYKYFKTKSQAIGFAKKYMRTH